LFSSKNGAAMRQGTLIVTDHLLLTQMAKTLGARVTATVSTREKASLSLEAGADEVLQYAELDFAEKINAAGKRMKAVYDSVERPLF
jgi:NADPH:quinone reductase